MNKIIEEIIDIFYDNGYEAYLVGGAVRDYLLDVYIEDFDIATNASLDEIKQLFKNRKQKEYKSKGLTIGVKYDSFYVEISTFKGKDIYEDLGNRDFTINAIAYNNKKGFIDPFNGRVDITRKIIRAVDNPDKIIAYDPIRILRAIRFSAIKGFKIADDLKIALIKNKDLLNTIKFERIQKEINPVLLIEKPSLYIREYKEIFFIIFDGLEKTYKFNQYNDYHHLDVFEHTLLVLDSTKNILPLRLAALFHDIGKPLCFTIDNKGIGHFYGHPEKSAEIANENLLKLCYNHDLIKIVYKVIYYHDYYLINDEKILLKFLYKFGTNHLDIYFGLKRADVLGQNPKYIDRIVLLDDIANSIKKIIDENKIITFKNLAIKGNDLVELGYEGHKIQIALDYLLKAVIEKRIKNNKEKLIELALKIKNEIQ